MNISGVDGEDSEKDSFKLKSGGSVYICPIELRMNSLREGTTYCVKKRNNE